MNSLFIETSALLRVLFQEKNYEETFEKIKKSDRIFSSRLLRVETERSILRVALNNKLHGEKIKTELAYNLKHFWPKFDFIEITKEICDLADKIAPQTQLRSLDAIHVATFFWLKTKDPDIKMLSYDSQILGAVE